MDRGVVPMFECSDICRDMEVMRRLDARTKQRQPLSKDSRQLLFQPLSIASDENTPETHVIESTRTTPSTTVGIPQFQHQRIRTLHGDHQPLYIAPPPAHFFPPFPQSTLHPPDTALKRPPLVRSKSAAELTNQTLSQEPPPVLATSNASSGTVTPTKTKRGRKPKNPVAHEAKKEAKERKRLEKEAAAMAEVVAREQQQIVFVAEEIHASATTKDPSSRPSTSGNSQTESTPAPPPSSGATQENKKRSADAAFSADVASSYFGNEESIDVDSTWNMSTPIDSPIDSSDTGGLGMFLQAPPSTPIDEILSSSAQLSINPALLLQEDVFPSRKLGNPVHALKSPLEILDEYSLTPQSPLGTSNANRSSTPSEDSSNRKMGLMDLMLHRNDPEEKQSPKKRIRPDLVFSTTKRGKAVVSLQKNASRTTELTTSVKESPIDDTETDLRSLVLKRRKQVWGDEVGTEVTRITVHRRLTARKTSVGLMSPLSPKSGNRAEQILDSDTDSSESSESEDEAGPTQSQVTPLTTPTHPLRSGQSMQKSFSAPGLFHPVSENLFLPTTPHPEDVEEFTIVHTRSLPKSYADDSGMRCKTCGMLFRRHSVLHSHERTCMVKQTPFIPYDFLRTDNDDGFVGRQLFNDDVILTPRNLNVQMGFESPLVTKGEGKRANAFVAPLDTVSSEGEETMVVPNKIKVGNVVGEPRGQTRCICNKPEKAVSGVMVQWYVFHKECADDSGMCEYWLHTRCLKVKVRDLPDEWYCPACIEIAENDGEMKR